MGSAFSPKTESVPPPQPVQYVNTRDEVGGTQSNYITNPDGSKTLVTTALPLSPEEQAVKDKYDQIAKDSLDYVTKLSTNYDVSQIPGLQDYLDKQKNLMVTNLDTATADQAQQEENLLARNGQADSTAGVKARAARGYNYGQQRNQIDAQLAATEQNARQQAIGNATNLFSLATGRQDANIANMMSSLARGQQFQLADAANQADYNGAVYNANKYNASLKSQANSTGLSSLASLAALGAYGFDKLGGFSYFGKKLGFTNA